MAKFKTRARALEMLGSQQIAGIPTAISELFKNAHDAYADRAEIDYYRSDALFVLRDDGFGMTKEDFEQRWLTLGTASKVGATTRKRAEFSMPGKPLRPILGEKGIGRLAIALIGSQVLILSRAVRDGAVQDLVAAFIHWGIFECPDLDLDDIEIPVQTFSDGNLPSKHDVQKLVDRFRKNLERLEDRIDSALALQIGEDLKGFDLEPREIDAYVPSMSLARTKHGTHFLIRPASAMLQQEIFDLHTEKSRDKAPNLVRMLGGFTNTMLPDHADPAIKVALREHKTDDSPGINIIDPEQFFTAEEFKKADHRIQGSFDAYGQFRGTIDIYGKKFHNHIISWHGGKGLPTACGPFNIAFATVQGAQRESRLSAEDWVELTSKMDKFGGLYIYRDGIRVLPYGNTDYDWLNIEKRRTYSASYYYFSFRRMFGVVSINRDKNGKLKEKAGREGFQENEAYRQFRSILENFLIQLAADFFRGKSPEKHFSNVKDELQRKAALREKRKKEAHGIRQKLAQNLEQFFRLYDAGHYSTAVNTLFEEIRQQLQSVLHMRNSYEASKQFLRIEKKGRQKLSALEKSCRIGYPRGFALDTNLQIDWSNYQETFAALQEKVFRPASRQLIQLIGDFSKQNQIVLDRRIRLEQTINEYVKETDKTTTSENKATGKGAESVHQKVKEELEESSKRVASTLRDVTDELTHLDVRALTESEIFDIQTRLQMRLQMVEKQECHLLGSIRRQLEAIDVTGGGLIDQLEAVEERTLALEEQADKDLQLIQLGMAIEIINHEFNASILAVREYLARLKNWAITNPDLQSLYQNIRNSFDHLDGYLAMLTPLHRRLQRKAVVFRGLDVYIFLDDLFSERLKRHNINIKATPAFKKIRIKGYPSSFYPVFVNLIDNAIFWLKDQPIKTITLDALDDGALIIKDSGPGIPARDKDRIFELGFSRKPGGRGMGLHISREVLRKVGYSLELHQSQIGAEFHIKPQK